MAGQYMMVGMIIGPMNVGIAGQIPQDRGTNPDFVIVTDGRFKVVAYVPFPSPSVRTGEGYTLSKIGNTYTLGTRVDL